MARFWCGKLALRSCVVLAAMVVLSAFSSPIQAQIGVIPNRQVAGVHIDADGILRNQDISDAAVLKREHEKNAQQVPGNLNSWTDLRKVSLRRLEEAILECKLNNKPLPDEIKYLAGIQKIRYVFVYPDQQDIVIAGPGEGWKYNNQGEVVGTTTGKPVMLLDDLLVALRSAERARQEGISCSIDPTAEGLSRLQVLAKSLKQGAGVVEAIEGTLGMQTISVTGVPADSHFARVIVAADYKMKRLAMNLDKAPVAGMPSYMEMVGTGANGMNNMLPRWWLAPNYEALLTDGEGTAWEFRTAGVKCVAEEDLLTDNGERKRQAKQSGPIKKWADNMTAKYEALSAKDVVFGQLRNCIDLAVVAALITKERLNDRVGHQFTVLADAAELPSEQFHAPTQVPSKASVMVKRGTWIISASGGVQVESWALADKAETAKEMVDVRHKSSSDSKSWWWN